MTYSEGSFFDEFFREFPTVRLSISSLGVIAIGLDGLYASTNQDEPDSPEDTELWKAIQSIPDLM
jgi:hypothetical protein